MATDHNFRIKNGLEVGGQLIVNSNGQLVVSTAASDLEFLDNTKLFFGDDSDLSIYHSGSHSFIQETGTGSLYIDSSGLVIRNASNNASMIVANAGGAVSLYNNGNLKLETTADGVDVTGKIQINDANTIIEESSNNSVRVQTNSGYIDIGPHNTSWAHIETDRPRFYFNKGISVNTGLIGSYDEDLQIQRAGTTKLTVTTTGVDIDGDLTITGDLNTVNTTTLDVSDKLITAGVGGTAATNSGGGFKISGANAEFLWDNTNTQMTLNKDLKFTAQEKLRFGNNWFQNSGDNNHVHFYSANGLIPHSTTTADNSPLGTSSYRWDGVFSSTGDFSGAVTVGGDIYAADSDSSTNPSITFTGHTNTGLSVYQVSSVDRLSIITGGGQRANFGTHGVESFANVYTGTSSSFRNYAGTWSATTGVTGNGFSFINSVDGTAATISAAGDAVFSGDVRADTHFNSTDTNATLSATGSGNVYLRPNGKSSTTGQVHIATSGNATFAGTISSGAITSTGDINATGNLYDGGNQVFHEAYHPNADKWTTSRTLTLGGEASGSVSWDGSANATLNVTLNDSALDNQYVQILPRHNADGDSLVVTNRASITIWDVSGATDAPSSALDGLVLSAGWDSASWGIQQYHDFHSNDLYLRAKNNGSMTSWDRVFHDAYHPNADKWTSSRTLTLGGDLSGSVSWDGSANVTLTATIADDSHNHIIANVDGLQAALDGKLDTSFDHAQSHKTWTGINAASTQAKRYHIARLYGCPAHWDSDWQNIEFTVTAESYESGYLKFRLMGDYGGAASQANMIKLFMTEAQGPMVNRFQFVLGSPVDAGWDHSGQDTFYVDLYAEAAHYSQWKVNAKNYGHGYQTSNPSSGGATTVFYTSPTTTNTTTFTVDHNDTYIRGYKIWNELNDGAGSGLDADKLDAQEGSYYLNYNNFTNTPTIPNASSFVQKSGDTMTGDLTFIGGNNSSKESFINVKRGDASGLWLKFQTDSTSANNVSQYVIRRSTDNVDILNLTATNGNIAFVGTVTASGGNSGQWNTAYGWGNYASAPNAPSITSTTVVNETIEIVFAASTSTGNTAATSYEVWSDGGTGSDYSLIAKIPYNDIASSMSVVDSSFDDSGTIAYRVYAIRHGAYSTAATTTRAFTMPTLDVSGMSVIPDTNNYYIQYELPTTRFIDHIEIYKDVETTSGALSRTGAALVYSGNNTSYKYNISSSDMDKYHQFWVEVVTV